MVPVTANNHPSRKCLGYRPFDPNTKEFGPYQWMDYSTVQRRRANFGVGIVEANKLAGVTDRKYGVGLWCQNRPEWQLTGRADILRRGRWTDFSLDLGCMSQSLFTVSLYDTLGPSATEYIINHAQVPCVATSLPHIPTLLKLKPRLPSLKVIISLDPLEDGDSPGHSKHAMLDAMAAGLDVRIYSIQEVEDLGKSLGSPVYHVPGPSDIITINYTSGTTGPPKGVVLPHSAAVAAASGALLTISQGPSDVIISYLPLAHIYQRMTEHSSLWAGCAIG